ncbi:DUF2840 domain-containing protein [Aestuariibius insulae]|uniref:DUF2840 domain-containing protein n=1 Tax=Aestuariibius insulae TaxID=2058287 RepID=UPI00345E4AE5
MSALTEVELVWEEGREERWIRFGRPSRERILDCHRRIVAFAPGANFALVRWQGNTYGTTASRIDVLRTLGPGESGLGVPCVTPGGASLLRLSGWPKVAAALAVIDAIEADGWQPERICLDHWRQVQNRLLTGRPPEPYSSSRHRAWELRKALTR